MASSARLGGGESKSVFTTLHDQFHVTNQTNHYQPMLVFPPSCRRSSTLRRTRKRRWPVKSQSGWKSSTRTVSGL